MDTFPRQKAKLYRSHLTSPIQYFYHIDPIPVKQNLAEFAAFLTDIIIIVVHDKTNDPLAPDTGQAIINGGLRIIRDFS